MSRREHIKKSLGISEYPWSSDDDDPIVASTPNAPETHAPRRQTSEPRPSVADMPGTSGQPPTSPTLPPVRGAKTRELLYSLLSDPHKLATMEVARTKLSKIPSLKYLSPLSWPVVVHTPAAELREGRERPTAADDIERMIPYKKLMRTLNALRTNKPSNNPSFGAPREPTRNPGPPPTEAEARASRANALKRLQTRRIFLRWHEGRGGPSSSSRPAEATATGREVGAGGSGLARSSAPASVSWLDEPVVIDEPSSMDQTDDVMELPETSNSPQPIADEIDAAEPEPIDVEMSHNTSGAGVSLEEEIVEIDAPDDADGDVNVTGDDNADNVVNTDVGLNEAAAAPSNDETVVLQQPSQESSRRRREGNSSPDSAEPSTIKEFNQNLLRLLECPVCLEWMEPPMSQCRRGHLVCARCRGRLAACPVCRTSFSSVRNRAMEGVADLVRYPCRHGCGREVRLRRRGPHEASCAARRYLCPAPACADRAPLHRDHLHHHFQAKHMSMLKIGRKHKFSMKVNSEQHDTWLITALHEYFYLRVDVDIRTWGVIVYVAYIGPKCNAKNYTYEVTVVGQHNSRKLVYSRVTHSDLESSSLNVSRQDCFHLTLDQALNFLRLKNRHCEPDKFLDFNIEINKSEVTDAKDSDS